MQGYRHHASAFSLYFPTGLTFVSGYRFFRMTSLKKSSASWTNMKVCSFEISASLPHKSWTEFSTGLLILLRSLLSKTSIWSKSWILRKAHLVFHSFSPGLQLLCRPYLRGHIEEHLLLRSITWRDVKRHFRFICAAAYEIWLTRACRILITNGIFYCVSMTSL